MRIVEGGEGLLNNVVEEDNYRDLVDEVVRGEQVKDDGDRGLEGEDLVGRIMINLNVCVMQVFKSKMSGNYLRKSSLIGYLNFL